MWEDSDDDDDMLIGRECIELEGSGGSLQSAKSPPGPPPSCRQKLGGWLDLELLQKRQRLVVLALATVALIIVICAVAGSAGGGAAGSSGGSGTRTVTFCRPDGGADVAELACDGESVGWRCMDPSAVELATWCNSTASCIRTHSSAVLSATGDLASRQRVRLCHYNRIGVLSHNEGISDLFESVHPDSTVVDAATACEQLLTGVGTELYLNGDQFASLQEVQGVNATAASTDPLLPRLLEATLQSFTRSGVDKDDATRRRLATLDAELTELTAAFSRNIAGARSVVRVPQADAAMLRGLDAEYVAERLNATTGMVEISTDYPDYLPAMEAAQNVSLRHQLYLNFNNRAFPENGAILLQVLQKRYEYARLLDFPNYAEFATATNMVRNATTVENYLRSILATVNSTSTSEMETLRQSCQSSGLCDDPAVPYTHGFAMTRYKEQVFSVNNTEIDAYFTTAKAQIGVFSMARTFFGVDMVRVANSVARPWHDSVEVYDVVNISSKAKMGRAYLDLYPREKKYKHAAVFPMRRGVDGIQLPEAALVCNFSPSPQRLAHDEVTTFFHEFGHLMHNMVAGENQAWNQFSGLSMAWDFVEAPSQMLEKWPVSTEILDLFATNDAGEVIPAQLINNMDRASKFGVSGNTQQQLYYAFMSLKLHQLDPTNLNVSDEVASIAREFSPYVYQPDTHMFASFGHLMGYSSNYYTYQWSLGIAQDMFYTRFCPGNMMDADVARDYREKVLSPGSKIDVAEAIADFLGRPWNDSAYTKYLRGEVRTTCREHFTI